MDWILEFKVPIFLALTLVITILGCFIALYAFHASTKGNHFREWKEFEPLDTPIPKVTWATVHRDPKLRSTCYKLLVSTLSIKLNHPEKHLTSEHIIYAVLEHFFPNCVPNSDLDNNDVKFSITVLEVIKKLQVMDVVEIRKFMQEEFPNQDF